MAMAAVLLQAYIKEKSFAEQCSVREDELRWR
jgi:hypothetical protein